MYCSQHDVCVCCGSFLLRIWTMNTKTTGQWESGIEEGTAPEGAGSAVGAEGDGPGSTSADQSTGSGNKPSGEQTEQLQSKAAKADEYWDRLVRQTADFDNYKKR